LHRNADAVTGTADTAFEHVRDVQLACDLAELRILAFEGECRVSGGHAQVLDLTQGIQDLLGQAVAEVLVLLISAQVGEGEHHNGFFGDRAMGRRYRVSGRRACRNFALVGRKQARHALDEGGRGFSAGHARPLHNGEGVGDVGILGCGVDTNRHQKLPAFAH
jgi:hypothetical protein